MDELQNVFRLGAVAAWLIDNSPLRKCIGVAVCWLALCFLAIKALAPDALEQVFPVVAGFVAAPFLWIGFLLRSAERLRERADTLEAHKEREDQWKAKVRREIEKL